MFAGRLFRQALYQRRVLRHARVLDASQINECAKKHRIQRQIKLLESPAANAPYTYGALHPVIVLPPDWLNEHLNETYRELVIEHEIIHIKRFDASFKALFALTCCLYWFNPILWIAYGRMKRDIELSCDECVLRIKGITQKKLYAHGLLNALQTSTARTVPILGFASQCIEERIESIVQERHTNTPLLVILLACSTLVALPCVCVAHEQTPGTIIDQGLYTITIPAEWNEYVEIDSRDGLTFEIHMAENSDLVLLWTEATDANEPLRETYGGSAILDTLVFNNTRIELWAINYASMSQADSWRLSYATNPVYPGKELEQLTVELSCGGRFELEDLWKMKPGIVGKLEFPIVDGFGYYREVIVPTFVKKQDSKT